MRVAKALPMRKRERASSLGNVSSSVREDPKQGKYRKGKLLGRGSFGEVWTCTDETSPDAQQFACKLIHKSSLKTKVDRDALKQELDILEGLKGQHAGVVQMREILDEEREVKVVMELCEGGDLFNLLTTQGKMPEDSAKLVFCQLASALACLHSKGIVHRDIKPENILFDKPAFCLWQDPPLSSDSDTFPAVQAKLSDFGLSTILKPRSTTQGYTGSKFYTAPEMVLGMNYGRRVDVWSLGVVLYAMLSNRLPFKGKTENVAGLRQAIIRGTINLDTPRFQEVSAEAKDLIRRMLEVDPKKRIRSCELLAHPWCAGPPYALSAGSGTSISPSPSSSPSLPSASVQRAVTSDNIPLDREAGVPVLSRSASLQGKTKECANVVDGIPAHGPAIPALADGARRQSGDVPRMSPQSPRSQACAQDTPRAHHFSKVWGLGKQALH